MDKAILEVAVGFFYSERGTEQFECEVSNKINKRFNVQPMTLGNMMPTQNEEANGYLGYNILILPPDFRPTLNDPT